MIDSRNPLASRRSLASIVTAILCALALLPSCASTGAENPGEPYECPSEEPLGEPEAFSLAGKTVEGVHVSDIETCGDGKAGYIRLDRDGGTRILTFARNADGSVNDCAPDAENPTTCPRVGVDQLLGEVHTELEARGIEAIGIGMGVCGENTDDYDSWNVSVNIRDWNDADEAVEVLAQKMNEWDVATHVGISVRGIACGTTL